MSVWELMCVCVGAHVCVWELMCGSSCVCVCVCVCACVCMPSHRPVSSADVGGGASESLSELSDAELQALEGRERKAVEERVRFLRRLRGEIDAMMARFGQYEMVAR